MAPSLAALKVVFQAFYMAGNLQPIILSAVTGAWLTANKLYDHFADHCSVQGRAA
jgi:hypothetical protein